MSVYFCIPSARPVAEVQPVVDRWREMGYKVALWRDAGTDESLIEGADYITFGVKYPGYARAVNELAREVLGFDGEYQWIVTGGDDTLPDPNKRADEIAEECERHFSPEVLPHWKGHGMPGTTFGVMQPTGDRFAGGSIDRIAGSPWMGREFCERMYGGNGPLFDGYSHMFVDEELLCVAERLGVYWRRPDLVHLHKHFMRESDDLHSRAVQKPTPPHLVKWNSPVHWEESKRLFLSRKAAGFPGHEPLPVEVAA